MSKQLTFTVPDEVERIVSEIASDGGKPIASVLREALKEYLTKRGHDVDTSVYWGRQSQKDDNSD